MTLAAAPKAAWLLRRGLLTLSAVTTALLLFLLYGGWLWGFPVSLGSDDALYFTRGLDRYAILDLSPHFPGYPAFIAMGRLVRLLVPDPAAALHVLTIASTLILPLLAAWLVWIWTKAAAACFLAFLIALTLPLLPLLALSGLSDSSGLLFFLLFLALLGDGKRLSGRRLLLAGLALGWAVAARPSYAPIFMPAYVLVAARGWRCAAWLTLGCLAVALPCLGVIIANEGWLYLAEAERFIRGHTQVWGNTAFAGRSGVGWSKSLAAHPTFAILLAFGFLAAIMTALYWRTLLVGQRAVLLTFLAAFVWTAAMQNPENLRHLAPLLLFGTLLPAALPIAGRFLALTMVPLLLVNIAGLSTTIDVPDRGSAPLAAALAYLETGRGPLVLVTNHGVALARETLTEARVYDLLYPATAEAGLASAEGLRYRLSSTPLADCRPTVAFPGRVPGEAALYLYRIEAGREPRGLRCGRSGRDLTNRSAPGG